MMILPEHGLTGKDGRPTDYQLYNQFIKNVN